MAQKIILFLSTPNRNAEKVDYDCPGEGTVSGVQTYDAPVKYLLNTHKAVSEILCIVTSDAKEQSWKRFEKELVPEALGDAGRKGEEVHCIPIDFPENASIQEILPQILGRTHEGDEILLETTGGLRNAMMYLLLISRALSYKGVETTCAVYSNYQPGKGLFRVEDVTEMLRVFDLIDGMQNLTSFGNVRALRRYYESRPHSEQIDDLLNAVDQLWSCITLCRSKQVPENLQAFNTALKGAKKCGDPLLEALLPAFQDKFGDEMTMPDLIRWCAESDMLQQALTLYRECIPAYIMNERTDILAVNSTVEPIDWNDKKSKQKYGKYGKNHIEWEARFYVDFLKMGSEWYKKQPGGNCACDKNGEKEEEYLTTLKYFKEALEAEESVFTTQKTVEDLRIITMDFMYIHALRNMVNHADDQAAEKKHALLQYLAEQEGRGYVDPEKATVDEVKQVILHALDHLEVHPQTA